MVDLNIALTMVSIIAPIVLFLGWIITNSVRLTNRITSSEMKQDSLIKEMSKLESKTSDDNLEKISRRVIVDVFHSEEFKREFKTTIRDTLLHIDKNRAAQDVGLLSLVLEKLEKLEKLEVSQ